MIPRFLTELISTALVGDWYGNLTLGLGAVAVGGLFAFVVALAVSRR